MVPNLGFSCQKHCTLGLVEMMWVATAWLYCVCWVSPSRLSGKAREPLLYLQILENLVTNWRHCQLNWLRQFSSHGLLFSSDTHTWVPSRLGWCRVFWTSGQTHRPTSRNWRWREVLYMETRKLGLNLCINFGSYSQFPLFKSKHSSTLQYTPSEAPKTRQL